MNNQPFPQQQPQPGMAQQQGQMPLAPDQYPPDEVIDQSIDDIKEKAERKNKVPQQLQKYIDSENIAEDLDDDALVDIGSKVYTSTEFDKDSRAEWTAMMEKAFKLIKNETESKNIPWEKAANIKYPLITGACIQFNSRTNPEIVRDDKVVNVRLMGKDDPQHQRSDRAQRLSDHMSYQLLVQSKNWVTDTDKMLMTLPMVGTVFRKSYFNPISGYPESKFCLPDDVVINNKVDSIDSALRITHIITMTANELIENMRAGLFIEYDLDDLAPSYDEDDRLKTDSEMSRDPEEQKYDAPHEIYEQHRYLDLDDDGYQEPYIVTVHKDSQKVLRIVARYDDDSFEWNKKGEVTKINPINYWTDYHLIPNPDGSFYSFGFGLLLYTHNETINSILNQLLDAGTLANRQSGFIGKGLRVPKGDFKFKPGEWKLIASAPGTQISQNIVPLPVKEPSTTLFNLMQFLIDSSKLITAVSDAMQGEAPPPATPAATTLALLEQGQKIYSAILQRIYNSLKKEFNKLYELNKKYLTEEETFPLAMGTGMITIADYKAPNYGIYPVADPKLSSGMQRLMRAQALMQLAEDPTVNKYEIYKNYLEALNVTDIDTILPPPKPQPPSPQVLLIEAQIKNTNVDTAGKLVDMEVALGDLQVAIADQQSRAANYGVKAADSKVDSIVKLSELKEEVPQPVIGEAITEEEALTRQTQVTGMPPQIEQRIASLEGMISNVLHPIYQQLVGQPQQPGAQPPAPGQAGGLPPMAPGAEEAAATGGAAPMPTEGE